MSRVASFAILHIKRKVDKLTYNDLALMKMPCCDDLFSIWLARRCTHHPCFYFISLKLDQIDCYYHYYVYNYVIFWDDTAAFGLWASGMGQIGQILDYRKMG